MNRALLVCLALALLPGCSGSRCEGLLARCGGETNSDSSSLAQELTACEQVSRVAEEAIELCDQEGERYDSAGEGHNLLALEVALWEATLPNESASLPEDAFACSNTSAVCNGLVACLDAAGVTLPATFPESPAEGTTVNTAACGEVVF